MLTNSCSFLFTSPSLNDCFIVRSRVNEVNEAAAAELINLNGEVSAMNAAVQVEKTNLWCS